MTTPIVVLAGHDFGLVGMQPQPDLLHPVPDRLLRCSIDAIVVKVRDGKVANRPFYVAIGVTLDGDKDILGL